jgi:hypothetical protein
MMLMAAGAIFVGVALAQAPKPGEKQSTKKTEAAAYRDAYDFKGVVRLGMTLSQFKAAPLPDEGDINKLPALYNPPSGPLCAEPDKNGIIKCTWGREGYNAVMIAGGMVAMHSFEFLAKPGDAEPRLFRMTFQDHQDRISDVIHRHDVFAGALADRFGKPTVEKMTLQNAFGAVFEREIRLWANKSGRIALIRFDPSLEYTTLRYFIPEYVDYHNHRLSESGRRQGPKL